MPIPPVTHFRVPLLQLLGDGVERPLAEAANALADVSNLRRRNGSCRAAELVIQWCGIARAGLAFTCARRDSWMTPSAASCTITEEGKKLLATKPASLSESVLMQFPKYQAWRKAVSNAAPLPIPAADRGRRGNLTEEAIANGYATLRANLAAELLERIMAKPSGFFERLVVDLLLAMGYGGSRAEAGTVTKASGDGGIDGVINEDRLGLDAVYVQAKRWEGNVGVGPLRKFVRLPLRPQGAQRRLHHHQRLRSLVPAEFMIQVSHKIVLIDGQRLAELMIDYGVGVSTRETYVLKRADEDYFAEG